MFESSAPKYKFGGASGSNENVTNNKKEDTPLRKKLFFPFYNLDFFE